MDSNESCPAREAEQMTAGAFVIKSFKPLVGWKSPRNPYVGNRKSR